MSNTLIATLGGVTALIGWGISDWLTAKSSKKHGNFEVNAAVQLPELFILGVILLLARPHINGWDNVGIVALGSLCFTAAFLSFIKALSSGAVGVIVPIGNSYPLITLILSLAFLSAVFSGLQVLAMVIIVLGAVVLAYEKGRKIYGLQTEILFACGAALMWGLGFFIVNTVVDKEKWQVVQGTIAITMSVVAIAMLMIKERSGSLAKIKAIRNNPTGLTAGVALTLGSVLLFISGERSGSLLIPAVIASAAPLITSFLAAVVDKERIGVAKRIGAVIVVAGIVLLNAG